MDMDLIEFEAPAEEAPALVLGKKKKKKKKPQDAGTSDPPVCNGAASELVPDAVPELVLDKKKKKKKKTAPEARESNTSDTPVESASAANAFASLLGPEDDGATVASRTDDAPIADDEERFSALDLDGPSEVVTPAKNKKNKKQNSPAEVEAVDAMLMEGDSIPPALEEVEVRKPLTAAQKKKAKKEREKAAKKKAEESDDIDAIMASLDAVPEPQLEAQNNESATQSVDNSDEIGDLLGELDSAPTKAAQKKKAKKKKKGNANEKSDDIDALLNEFADNPRPANVDPPSIPVVDEATATTGDVDDLMAELGDNDGGGKMTAAQKKKDKKKKKKAAAAAAKGSVDAGTSLDTTGGGSSDPKKGKKPKKESAAVRKMREQRERMAAAEEALRKAREEEEARLAEEERLKQEAENKKAEERAKKKAAEKARKERKRAEGTLLSKAEKERRRKAELFKEQLRAQGLVPVAAVSGSSVDQNRKGVGNRRRKKIVPGPSSSNADAPTVEAADASQEISPLLETEMDKPSAVEEKVPDTWDAVPDDWEKEEEVVDAGASEAKPAAVGPNAKQDEHADVEHDENEDVSSSEEDSDDSNEFDGMGDASAAAEKRLFAIRRAHEKRRKENLDARTPDHLRSPIICILGHVDTGKTKILDRIRRTNVQDGEAGGITQQIGATYFPIDAVKKETMKLPEGENMSYNVPSLLIIDTPGHESFTNLRSRGSSLCDIAILVIDIMHGIEPQTRESIDLLKLRKTPFIVALNKIDRMFDWQAQPNNCPTRESLSKQKKHAKQEFMTRVKETKLQLTEIGFNSELYWENEDVRKAVSIVPTSAITGEGIPDLLMLLLSLPQKLLTPRLMFNATLEATVLEVKVIPGLGTTIDIVLTGGIIHEGDTIMVVGLDGPITTTIRALLTPHPMKEMRVKGQYLRHSEIKAAQGIKISAEGLEKAVAGTQIVVVSDPDDDDEMEYAREEVMKDFSTILQNVDKSGVGVYVQASTLGSLEALLEFLRTSKIPVSGINIGPVHKKDIKKASAMLERRKEFATVLAFDVKVEGDARELAEEVGVQIFTADIIYHLFDQFMAYMEDVKRMRREDVSDDVVFPSICRILPQHIYNKKDPIVLGVDVLHGIVRVGTPLVVRHGEGWLDVGRIASIEANQKQVKTARKGESVCLKIQHKNTEHIMYGRHFDFKDELVSKMSRRAIDLLKENFRDDLETEDWRLVVRLKTMFNIM